MPNPNRVVEAVARAIWLAEEVRGERTVAKWDEFLAWYHEGAADPNSCVHYSTIGIAIRRAQAAIRALAENVSEGMVDVACDTYEDAADYAPACHVMKDAIKAALLAAAGEVEGVR